MSATIYWRWTVPGFPYLSALVSKYSYTEGEAEALARAFGMTMEKIQGSEHTVPFRMDDDVSKR